MESVSRPALSPCIVSYFRKCAYYVPHTASCLNLRSMCATEAIRISRAKTMMRLIRCYQLCEVYGGKSGIYACVWAAKIDAEKKRTDDRWKQKRTFRIEQTADRMIISSLNLTVTHRCDDPLFTVYTSLFAAALWRPRVLITSEALVPPAVLPGRCTRELLAVQGNASHASNHSAVHQLGTVNSG